MKCIDAIEGALKQVLTQLHTLGIEDRLDDSEYIRNVKAVLDGTDRFIQSNPELVEDPQTFKQVLYAFARNLWLMGQKGAASPEPAAKLEEMAGDEEDYQTYYFDYLYHRGVYPR